MRVSPADQLARPQGGALVLKFGIPGVSSARCIVDKHKGTVQIFRRSLFRIEREEAPLGLVDHLYVRRDRKGLSARYAAVFTFRYRDQIKVGALSRGQAKRAILRIRAFLDNRLEPIV